MDFSQKYMVRGQNKGFLKRTLTSEYTFITYITFVYEPSGMYALTLNLFQESDIAVLRVSGGS